MSGDPAERWQRVHGVFEDALDIAASERAAFVNDRCGDDVALRAEVMRLLAAHHTAGPLDRLLAELHPQDDVQPDPEQIGVWRIVGLIGRGGMGAVYRAERADGQYEQRAALKLLRRDVIDPDVRRRFFDERRILARIEHPGIARILDGGVTPEGRPWFALEYVEGLRIDRWCEQHGLPLRARLALFREVCAAAQHAHAHLIVHRDIKPANVLVTADGHARLLDFGIAKLLDTEAFPDAAESTVAGHVLLTPTHASPEQLRGEQVGTASDVFQLGLLLFELLTGRMPRRVESTGVDVSLAERPSAVAPEPLRRGIDRDLDTIVLAATRAEPQRRYASADQFSEDVQRWLDGLPIRARPDSFPYRAGRFVRRHRVAVPLVGTFAVLLVAFASFTTVQAHRLERERDRARQVVSFLTELFERPNPHVPGAAPATISELADRGTLRIRAGLSDPLLRAELLSVLGATYAGLGQNDKAVELQREALALRETGQRDHAAIGEARRRLAFAHVEASHPDSALPHAAEAVRLLRRHAPRSPALAEALGDHGLILRMLGQSAAAEPFLEEAVALFDANPRASSHRLPVFLAHLGYVLRARGEHARAEELMRRSVAIAEPGGQPAELDSLRSDAERAERTWAGAVAETRELRGADHPSTAILEINHARALGRLGRFHEADPILRGAITSLERAWPQGDARLARALADHGSVLTRLERHAEAESLLRRALDMLAGRGAPDSPGAVLTSGLLAECLTAQRRFDEAEPLLLAVHHQLVGRDTDDTEWRDHVLRLVGLYEQWGRPAEAARFRALLPPLRGE
jgi:eukaryotic-like serine/threonine-protein kinase